MQYLVTDFFIIIILIKKKLKKHLSFYIFNFLFYLEGWSGGGSRDRRGGDGKFAMVDFYVFNPE